VRSFVAIDIGPPLDALRAARAEAPDHLTLRFLGEVPPGWLEGIGAAMRSAAATVDPFDLTIEGVGAFPSARAPRVVWVGATTGREEVIRLAAAIGEALGAVGIPAESEELVPHVTLFRVRSPRDRSRAQHLLDGTEPPPPPRSVRVTEVLLKGSEPTHSGPVHRTLERAPLGRGTGSA
jgi:RNA 2',3'-cyclic 3'-phosphodiesterase